MSLAEVLTNLSNQSKKSFLEKLLPSARALDDNEFATVSIAASEVSVDLGVQYLLSKEKLEEAIALLEKAGEPVNAAELCKKHGLRDRAAENYECTHIRDNVKKAAEIYLGVEYELEPGAKVEKISALENAGKYKDASELCKEAGMVVRAVQNLKLAGNTPAAEELEKNSNPIKAAEVWERNHYQTEAENLLFRNGLFKELAALNERAGFFVSAASNYTVIEDFGSALRCYKQDKFSWCVEKILLQLGKEDQLVEYWHEVRDFSSLALYYNNKDPLQAAVYYEELKDYQTAAQCLVKAQKPLKAMQLLVRNNYHEDALRIGDTTNPESQDDIKLKQVLITNCYEELAPRYETSDPE